MRAVLKCIAGACVMLACFAPLEELSKSEDVWVRQAAEPALKSQDGEWGEAWR
jgi:hypothetical protein